MHSIVGLPANTTPTEPWPPESPVNEARCAGAFEPGAGHQGMSVLTNGLRFPVCNASDIDAFLDAVSADTTVCLPVFSDGFESGDILTWSLKAP